MPGGVLCIDRSGCVCGFWRCGLVIGVCTKIYPHEDVSWCDALGPSTLKTPTVNTVVQEICVIWRCLVKVCYTGGVELGYHIPLLLMYCKCKHFAGEGRMETTPIFLLGVHIITAIEDIGLHYVRGAVCLDRFETGHTPYFAGC